MNKWKQYIGLFFLPSFASIFLLGLALQGHGIIRVSIHILRNIFFLIPRLPSTIFMLWSEHSPTAKDSNSKRYNFFLLIIGMPFLLILILLDDYES